MGKVGLDLELTSASCPLSYQPLAETTLGDLSTRTQVLIAALEFLIGPWLL